MDYLRMDGKQYASKVRNKALEDFDWLSHWLEWKFLAETGYISNATFSDKSASSGVRFSFSLQDYFHNLYVFVEIYKIMFFFVSKYLRHCVGSTNVLCLHCHFNPHRPRFTTTCYKNLLQWWLRKWNLTLFSFILPAIKLIYKNIKGQLFLLILATKPFWCDRLNLKAYLS